MVKYIFGGLALIVFGIFVANMITIELRDEGYLTRVQEFLTLALACLFFVIMVLLFERDVDPSDLE